MTFFSVKEDPQNPKWKSLIEKQYIHYLKWHRISSKIIKIFDYIFFQPRNCCKCSKKPFHKICFNKLYLAIDGVLTNANNFRHPLKNLSQRGDMLHTGNGNQTLDPGTWFIHKRFISFNCPSSGHLQGKVQEIWW